MQNVYNNTRLALATLCVIIFYGLTCPTLNAQSVAANSGGHIKNSDIQLSFTLGEVTTETLNNGDVILTQGFNQTKLTLTFIEGVENDNYNVLIYPNPTSGQIKISIAKSNFNNLTYSLFNIDGAILKQETISTSESIISLNEYKPGIYLLKIIENNKDTQTYRIVKQ